MCRIWSASSTAARSRAIAHPQVADLLLTLGTLGLTIELWSPGAILPGVAGGICLLLAFFAFQVLPVSYAGILLILFGLALLVLEVKVTSFGLLAVGGIISLFLGSMMLIDSFCCSSLRSRSRLNGRAR